MLQLKNIKKQYDMPDTVVQALKGIDIEFRKSEFVSILGPSGCGKTTLLNIIGGLDKYSSGDLIINNISTKEYTDKDWDNYRNKRIGFIFQSYNLIPHLTVLENVELALTLSGIGKDERKKRAEIVLEKVGLKGKLKNKPNQLSGGQMQRVAIARALVNNPEIILADEPTGALDSKTSVQIMELLKEISKDRLIVMVTHNPDLAKKYSSRIIKLLDGEVVSDSNPYKMEEVTENTIEDSTKTIEDKSDDLENKLNTENNTKIENNLETKVEKDKDTKADKKKSKPKKQRKEKKARMGLFTALTLSFKNLLTKKARTFLVSFAGSIGIIGIALVLSLSVGFQSYVDTVQKETLSSYPIQLTKNNYDMASLMKMFFTNSNEDSKSHNDDKIYAKEELVDMLNKFNSSFTYVDIKNFKNYIENEGKEDISKCTTAIQYVYNEKANAYYNSSINGLVSANDTSVFLDIIENYYLKNKSEIEGNDDKKRRYNLLEGAFGMNQSMMKKGFWSEMIDNPELLQSQYELVGQNSKWATKPNEIMIVVDKNNELTDYTLYGLGLLDATRLETLLDDYVNNRDSKKVETSYTLDDILNMKYKMILEGNFYEKQPSGIYNDIRKLKNSSDPAQREIYRNKLNDLYSNAYEIKVSGILRLKENASGASIGTCIAYNHDLTKYLINENNKTEVVKAQLASPLKDVVSGEHFTMTEKDNLFVALYKLNYIDINDPNGINLYPIDFKSKKDVEAVIEKYNNDMIAQGHQEKVITYNDTTDDMMQSVTTIISAITYVLIAFVSISLIVSSIMIGIITYISVLERTKEIGVLRSIGASKRDIKRVFVSESVIIGVMAGILGIVVTLILNIPINIIINSLTGLGNITYLPFLASIILILVSTLLTFIAGLIPARIASKKDPVIALRTE